MENVQFDDGFYSLEIHSTNPYSKELAQKIENALEDVEAEITRYSGEDTHYGKSVHNSPEIASVYRFSLKEDIAAVDVHAVCCWSDLDESYDIDYKFISLSGGEQLIWCSQVSWWDELWYKYKRDIEVTE